MNKFDFSVNDVVTVDGKKYIILAVYPNEIVEKTLYLCHNLAIPIPKNKDGSEGYVVKEMFSQYDIIHDSRIQYSYNSRLVAKYVRMGLDYNEIVNQFRKDNNYLIESKIKKMYDYAKHKEVQE